MKYLKKFTNHTAYEAYVATDFAKPNVSLCEQENEVHYNPFIPVETRVVVKYNVTSTSESTKLTGSNPSNNFTEMEIDGVVQPEVVSAYTFSTIGEHVVKYTLRYATTIADYTFYMCHKITSVVIPDSVTSIGDYAFMYCSSLTNATIGNGVTTIGREAFSGCENLATITLPSSITSIGDYAFCDCQLSTAVRNTISAINPDALECNEF